MITHSPHEIARSLGGQIAGRNILAPGPGHSSSDRSLSVRIDPAARDGFIVHSFAGDPPIACRDHVRAALGLSVSRKKQQSYVARKPLVAGQTDNSRDHSAFAQGLWDEALDPRGTVVADYLSSRGLALPDDVAGHVVRFHPALKYDGVIVGGMVALFRDIYTNAPCGLHRTFLDSEGRKLGRRMLGRAKHAAIKIDHDENVTMGLTIGEGFETCLAAGLAGFRPVWALGSVGGIAKFPVLHGIEAITILGEVGDAGANHRASKACAERWIEAGQEAFVVTPLVGSDLNDVWREAAR
jgi:putative DNA primase/helicase